MLLYINMNKKGVLFMQHLDFQVMIGLFFAIMLTFSLLQTLFLKISIKLVTPIEVGFWKTFLINIVAGILSTIMLLIPSFILYSIFGEESITGSLIVFALNILFFAIGLMYSFKWIQKEEYSLGTFLKVSLLNILIWFIIFFVIGISGMFLGLIS